jgi:hypothetical protein
VAAEIHSNGGHSPPYKAVGAHLRMRPSIQGGHIGPLQKLNYLLSRSLVSGINPVDETGKGDGFPDVVEAADPGHQAL